MESVLKQYPQDIIERAKRIKLMVVDIDGVMTDGSIIYDDNGVEYKKFSVKDGAIMRQIREAEIVVGVVTGRDSPVVHKRCEELKVNFHHHGVKDKRGVIEGIIQEMNFSWEEVSYIGDDFIDVKLLKSVGLAVTPADAKSYIQECSHFSTQVPGGKGVFREVADLVLASQGKLKVE